MPPRATWSHRQACAFMLNEGEQEDYSFGCIGLDTFWYETKEI